MEKIKALYYGSCWPTNIGNSFVDLGGIQTIKSATNNENICHIGAMSSYLFSTHKNPENTLDYAEFIDCDYVIFGGMTQCNSHFSTQETILKSYVKHGTKIIILGGGAEKYDENEVKIVRNWMKKIPIYAFISRDEYSYIKYKDSAEHSYNGIDCALFISDYLQPPKINNFDFVVYSFDSTEKEPVIDIIDDKTIIRTHHACWPTTFHKYTFKKKNTLISDLPSDYLLLYANTSVTYSDRVHACLATLAYGNYAKLYGRNNPRLSMFERLNASNILNKPVKLDMEYISREKEKQIEFLKEVLI